MMTNKPIQLAQAIRYGLLSGLIVFFLCVIGLVSLFGERELITDFFTMGQFFLFATPAALAYTLASNASVGEKGKSLLLYLQSFWFFLPQPMI
jgi:ABC-type transport system involved in cytochrome c biogenesis permease subunit